MRKSKVKKKSCVFLTFSPSEHSYKIAFSELHKLHFSVAGVGLNKNHGVEDIFNNSKKLKFQLILPIESLVFTILLFESLVVTNVSTRRINQQHVYCVYTLYMMCAQLRGERQALCTCSTLKSYVHTKHYKLHKIRVTQTVIFSNFKMICEVIQLIVNNQNVLSEQIFKTSFFHTEKVFFKDKYKPVVIMSNTSNLTILLRQFGILQSE